MLVIIAAMFLVLALVFILDVKDIYIKQGKKKAYLEILKAMLFILIGMLCLAIKIR